MKTIFVPEAEEELLEASRYYESEAPGVGVSFIVEVHKTIQTIADLPFAAPVIRDGIRRKIINNFPYSILYDVEDDFIVVVAVAHGKRRPIYWSKRTIR